MPALDFNQLPGITTDNYYTASFQASRRARDRDLYQTITFRANPSKPFNGRLHVQGTMNPGGIGGVSEADYLWVDIMEIEGINEGGTWFVQFPLEVAQLRIACKTGNMWRAAFSEPNRTITANGSFNINGITVSVTNGMNVAQVANAINGTSGIISAGNIVADTVLSGSVLRIRQTNATPYVMTLANVGGTPLTTLGIAATDYAAGEILGIEAYV